MFDARRTCRVIAAISQFGNITEKAWCHAGDQTGEQRADCWLKSRVSLPLLGTMWDAICCREKTRGVSAKVVTSLSTVTDSHPVLSGEW